MTLYQKFKKLNIDFSAIGLERRNDDTAYFCTPRGAHVIGWAGVDGIHYCSVRGQGELIFAVSPMNEVGRNVFPIARNFEDLLRLLLACGSLDALEQAHQWDEEQFDEYVAENPPSEAMRAVFEVLRDRLAITPMEEPFAYLEKLQNGYDYGQLNFSKEYYQAYRDVPANPVPSQWRVTLEGDFQCERGKAGREIPLGAQFHWGDEIWHVPSVYLCSGGLVADFCIEINQERLRSFYQAYRAMEDRGIAFTAEEQTIAENENPTNVDFRPCLVFNGEELRYTRGSGQTWIPPELTGDSSWEDQVGGWVLDHYGLDRSRAWIIRRCTFRWEGRRGAELRSLALRLERDKMDIPVFRFRTPEVGGSVQFAHPTTGVLHTLTVQELENRELAPHHAQEPEMEYPTHFTAMTYTMQPDLPNDAFMLKDCDRGDAPRPRHPDPHGRLAMSVGVVAMIRSPGATVLENGETVQLHAICSHMHFQPLTEPVQWRLIVREKQLPDVCVTLI